MAKVPILKEKLNLCASDYYVLEKQVFDALRNGRLTVDDIKSIISNAQSRYFLLKLEGYNFTQISSRLKVDPSTATQACKRAVIFIAEYLKKSNKQVA